MDKVAVALALSLLCGCGVNESGLRKKLAATATGKIDLPAGVVDLTGELELAAGSHDLEIVGHNTTLRAGATFRGRALLVGERVSNLRLHDVAFAFAPELRRQPLEMAPPENAFRVYYPNNGVLVDQSAGIYLDRLKFSEVPGFAVLVSRSSAIQISAAEVKDSGSKNKLGRNNLTGGILIEEGSHEFTVRDSTFTNILGNGLWTHSLYSSPRLHAGEFSGNRFDTIGRDALQAGHVSDIRIAANRGRRIGWPFDAVDVENGGTPVVVDTAGDVETASYLFNEFEEVNGKCFDLDGFHDGEVRRNSCINHESADKYPHGHFAAVMNNTNPNMHARNIWFTNNLFDGVKYGGLFLIGSGHHVEDNRFLNVNLAGCNESSPGCVYKADEPDMLRSGIYLSRGVARLEDTVENIVTGNTISGHGMATHCVTAAPGVRLGANMVRDNDCRDVKPANAILKDPHAH